MLSKLPRQHGEQQLSQPQSYCEELLLKKIKPRLRCFSVKNTPQDGCFIYCRFTLYSQATDRSFRSPGTLSFHRQIPCGDHCDPDSVAGHRDASRRLLRDLLLHCVNFCPPAQLSSLLWLMFYPYEYPHFPRYIFHAEYSIHICPLPFRILPASVVTCSQTSHTDCHIPFQMFPPSQ